MGLIDLEESPVKLNNIEEFKKIIEETLYTEGKFKTDWLNVIFKESSKNYRATVTCTGENCNANKEYFKHNGSKIVFLEIFDIHYFENHDNSPVYTSKRILLDYATIKAIKQLEDIE